MVYFKMGDDIFTSLVIQNNGTQLCVQFFYWLGEVCFPCMFRVQGLGFVTFLFVMESIC